MAQAAPTEELVALCRVAAKAGGFYVTHVRDEDDGLVEVVAEALAMGHEAGLPVILSHHKALGAHNHGRVTETLAMVDVACACQTVGLDVYPYTYSSTSLTPERAARGGEVVVTRSASLPQMAGRRLSEIAAELGCSHGVARSALRSPWPTQGHRWW
jgi:N-acyl-D-amino-acid deacylase